MGAIGRECMDAVLDGPVDVEALADDIGYTTAEVYATALETARERYDPTGGSRATGYDTLVDVEAAIAARQVTA